MSKKMKHNQVWVSRDLLRDDAELVDLWPTRPQLRDGRYYHRTASVVICLALFRGITGIHLDPGELKRIEIDAREICHGLPTSDNVEQTKSPPTTGS